MNMPSRGEPGEGIRGLFEEIDAIIEEKVELTRFSDAEPG